jgi:hypothetical protein
VHLRPWTNIALQSGASVDIEWLSVQGVSHLQRKTRQGRLEGTGVQRPKGIKRLRVGIGYTRLTQVDTTRPGSKNVTGNTPSYRGSLRLTTLRRLLEHRESEMVVDWSWKKRRSRRCRIKRPVPASFPLPFLHQDGPGTCRVSNFRPLYVASARLADALTLGMC